MSHHTIGRNGSSVWTTTGCRSLRVDKVREHEKLEREQHQDAVKIERQNQTNIQTATSERTQTVCASKVVHFLVKHNIVHTAVYEYFIDFAINELKSPVLAHLFKGRIHSTRAVQQQMKLYV
jgi:hypothetical protein